MATKTYTKRAIKARKGIKSIDLENDKELRAILRALASSEDKAKGKGKSKTRTSTNGLVLDYANLTQGDYNKLSKYLTLFRNWTFGKEYKGEQLLIKGEGNNILNLSFLDIAYLRLDVRNKKNITSQSLKDRIRHFKFLDLVEKQEPKQSNLRLAIPKYKLSLVRDLLDRQSLENYPNMPNLVLEGKQETKGIKHIPKPKSFLEQAIELTTLTNEKGIACYDIMG